MKSMIKWVIGCTFRTVVGRSVVRNCLALTIGFFGSAIASQVTSNSQIDWLAIPYKSGLYIAIAVILAYGIFEHFELRADTRWLSTHDSSLIDEAMRQLMPTLIAKKLEEIQSGQIKSMTQLRKEITGDG